MLQNDEQHNSWAEFDRIVASMDENEKPKLEDFPRCKIVRSHIDFDGNAAVE